MKYRILYFIDRFKVGGIQIFLDNLLKNIDKNKFECDFLTLDDGKYYDFEQQIINDGGKVYKLKGIWIDKITDYYNYEKSLKAFFKEHHEYIAIHLNSSSKNYRVLYYAAYYNIPVRIAHSHSSRFQSQSRFKHIFGNILQRKLKEYATDYFACSDLAAIWMFGKKEYEKGNVHIIPNAIDLDKFKYNVLTREKKRTELGLTQENFVVINVGRFSEPKNHRRLIQIFSQIVSLNQNAKLLLAGTGSLETDIQQFVKQMGLTDKVIFLGFRNDVNELIQCADAFLMPSLYEGFPVTAIEAQASGCPCILSSTITSEAKILDNTEFVSLEKSDSEWARVVLKASGYTTNREKVTATLREKGFDIKELSNRLEEFYLGDSQAIKKYEKSTYIFPGK